jgi:cobalt-zinc-cadmium efflux system protein
VTNPTVPTEQESAHPAKDACPSCAGDAHDHDHGHSHGHGAHLDLRRASSRALWLALVILGVSFFLEIVGGVLTHSLALISDAAHLLTDVAAIALALFAQWFALKPSSAVRSFGYRRVEILAALLNGFTLFLLAIYIGIEAWHRFQKPPHVLGWPMIIVATAGLLAQLLTMMVLRRAQGQSLNVRGPYLHAMTDVLQSVGVVAAGIVLLLTKWQYVDPIASLIIGVFILWSAGQIMLEATHVLIEGTPKEVDLGSIAAMIQGTPRVLRVTDLHAWSLTSGYNALSAHLLAVPSAEDAGNECLRRKIAQDLCQSFPIQHVTLQIEQECEQCKNGECGTWLEDAARAEEKK